MRRLAARGLLKRAALKPGAIITPRDDWPRFDGGFAMEAQGAAKGGKLQFGYVYSQAYQVGRGVGPTAAAPRVRLRCQAVAAEPIAPLLPGMPARLLSNARQPGVG